MFIHGDAMSRLTRVFIDKRDGELDHYYTLSGTGFYRIKAKDAKASLKNGATLFKLPGGERP